MKIHRLFAGRASTIERLETALQKAKASGASRVWCDFRDWPFIAQALSQVSVAGFEWLVEVPIHKLDQLSDGPAPDRWVLVSQGTEDELRRLSQLASPFWLLLRPELVVPARQLVGRLPEAFVEQTWFEFLPWKAECPQRYTVREVRKLIAEFHKRFPQRKVLAPPGLEIWDDRLDPNLEVEPLCEPVFAQRISQRTPRISVIIPTYDNSLFIQSVLGALARQDLAPEEFEIVLVDDGSTDDTREQALKVMENEKANFTYFYLPRPAARTTGDNHYRAGIARNLGAKHSRGQWLQFLDSDILVPSHFLRTILAHTGLFDVIQCERYHIRPKFCESVLEYDQIDLETQTYVEDASYWKPFFATDNWVSLDKFWKHTCSYCLTVKRVDFELVGRFKRTFTTYGFEDVDLGYELAQRGRKFSLLHEKTLHLTPHRHRSEYGHSRWIRDQLLRRTAKTFFRQHLDPEIHDMFPMLMAEGAWWARLKSRLGKKRYQNGASDIIKVSQ